MRRVAELDAMRGIAAIVILLYHLRFVGIYPLWQTAVDLFFVLSGYLITTIILDGRDKPGFLRIFYIRRSLRIWPIYYLGLVLVLVINPFLHRPQALVGWPQYLTYTQFTQFYWGERPPIFSQLYAHTWTLAIEEQFYILWPLVVLVLPRRWIAACSLSLVALPCVLRTAGLRDLVLLSRCDGLALGALLAVILFQRAQDPRFLARFKPALAGLGLGMLAVPLWRPLVLGPLMQGQPELPWTALLDSLQLTRLNLLYFALVGLVVTTPNHPWLAFLRWRPFVRAGVASYGLYLYHPIVFGAVIAAHTALGIKGSIWVDMVKFVLSFVVAAISWRLIEWPVLSLKDRFTYKPRPAERDAIPRPHLATAAPDPSGEEATRPAEHSA